VKECKSIEAINKMKRRSSQASKLEKPIRMSHSKGTRISRNRSWELLELMKEYKSTEAMDNPEMHIRQEWRVRSWNQMSLTKGSGRSRSIQPK
jgi:hypothetical protein